MVYAVRDLFAASRSSSFSSAVSHSSYSSWAVFAFRILIGAVGRAFRGGVGKGVGEARSGMEQTRRMGDKERCIPVSIIAAVSYPSMGIGYRNTLPWKPGSLPLDVAFFTTLTSRTNRPPIVKGDGCNKHTPKRLVNVVVMGRLTWESLPKTMRPLPDRINIVVSKSLQSTDVSGDSAVEETDKIWYVSSLDEAIEKVQNGPLYHLVEQIFIIGGAFVYTEALQSDVVSRIYLTRVNRYFESDVFFPAIPCNRFTITSHSTTYADSSHEASFDFLVYDRLSAVGDIFNKSIAEGNVRSDNTNGSITSASEGNSNNVASVNNQGFAQAIFQPSSNRKRISGTSTSKDLIHGEHIDEESRRPALPAPLMHIIGSFTHEEYQYLDAVRDIIQHGCVQEDRTGTGILSKFGCQMRYNLRETFPLLTTKRVYWKGVVEELLWFIRGDTNSKLLSDVNVKIWDKNGTREFLDSRGLQHREVGDLGPVYGFQWRHFGADYIDMHTDYMGKGVDQLAECIKQLKTCPSDRRIILSAWNPSDLSRMALPPCHMFCQFFVANGELSCQMYQRSCDMGLGVPFNIASYSLLTLLIAQVCGLKPGEFIHVLGNAHVYLNHVKPLKVQLQRTPLPFPIVKLNPDVLDINEFKTSDIELNCYTPMEKIPMDMAV